MCHLQTKLWEIGFRSQEKELSSPYITVRQGFHNEAREPDKACAICQSNNIRVVYMHKKQALNVVF